MDDETPAEREQRYQALSVVLQVYPELEVVLRRQTRRLQQLARVRSFADDN